MSQVTKKVSALILAAGKGSRIGSLKQLLPWNKETFIGKVHRSLLETNLLEEILVVAGYRINELGKELRNINASLTLNPYYQEGLHSTIKWGLTKLQKDWDGVLIAYVDQPQLESKDYARIITFYKNSNKNLAQPYFIENPGNPCIIGFPFLNEVLEEPNRDQGCSYLFSRHPEDVLKVPMLNSRCLVDFNTMDSLQNYSP